MPSSLSHSFLIWLLIASTLWPLPVLAQVPQMPGQAPQTASQAVAPPFPQLPAAQPAPPKPATQAKTSTNGRPEPTVVKLPTECLAPQSLSELQTCSKSLETINPALVGQVRDAVAKGDLDKAKKLINDYEHQLEDEAKAATEQAEKEKKAADRLTKESPFACHLFDDLSMDIQPYGYNLFQGAAPTAGATHQPVGPDYILGPDDEFTVTVWGQVDGVYKVKVNREGEVVFPRVGAVTVTGMTFGELKHVLGQAFAQQFKGALVSIAMGQLRAIQVYVVGEAQKPGSYVLTSLSTALTALFAAGGVTKTGSLRDIRVLRGNKVIADLDLYRFLLKGDKSQDVRLQDQDTVFIPLVGPVVGVTGHVLRPAIYEVEPNATLGDALELAGGVQPTGYRSRVQVERMQAHERRIAIDFNLQTAQPAEGLRSAVQHMDMIKVFPINPLLKQVVYLKGNVLRPGPYELKPDMRITDVVRNSDDLMPDTYLFYARILRYIGPELARQTVPFNLAKAFAGDPAANVALQPLDEIEIYKLEDMRAFPSVTIVGEVRKPGNYPLLRSMRISDLIIAAGGLQKLAYQKDAELTRYTVVGERTQVEIKHVDIEKAAAGQLDSDLELQELDSLAVRPIPESEVGRKVTLQGEVRLPGDYSIQRGEHLSSVLKRAGGFSDRAYPQGLILIRESVKQAQQAQLQKFLATQKAQIISEGAAYAVGAGTGTTQGQAQGQAEHAATAAQLQVLEQIVTLITPGRVVVKVDSLDRLEGAQDDVLLEPGDQITVPQLPTEVSVVGAVRNSTSLVFRPGLEVDDYVQQAGGMSRDASKSDIYIVRADGSAESRYMSDRAIKAGDTIVVPQIIEAKTRPLQLWQTVATILGSVMLGVAAISVIGR